MITEESLEFLRNIPPFQFLDKDMLLLVGKNLSLQFFPKDTFILTQDGPPSDSLRVIKKGGAKVYISNDDDIVIDYKSEGDSLGFLSLVSGDKARANVLAIEDTLCYLIPKSVVLQIISSRPDFGEYFMQSFFKTYLDRTYKEMRDKNLLFKEGEKLFYTTPVKTLLSRSAVTAPGTTTIQDAANIMSQHGISSLIITDEKNVPVGIITDRDLREKVVAQGADLSAPIETIMSLNLVTVDAGKTCFDALSSMIQRNIHHMIVTENGQLSGVVTNHDFMLLQGTSPLSILKNIDRQKNVEELGVTQEKIDQIIALLLKEGVKAGHILRIITELHDRLIHKIIKLSMEKIGEAPCPFAFFAYGAEGRKEETFKTVFRCAIVYEEISSSRKIEMNAFCGKLLDHLQKTFAKCNLPLFDLKPLGENMPIYGGIPDWENNIVFTLKSKDSERLDTGKKMIDIRVIYGDASIVESLKTRLYKSISSDKRLMSAIFDHEARKKSPRGFLKKFVVDESGEKQEKLDIKARGILLIVDAMRALAVVHNIHETSTMERLQVLARKKIISPDIRADASSAFEFLLHLLLQAQLLKREAGIVIDNVIEPEKLSVLEKKTLKEVFSTIDSIQNSVRHRLRQGEEVAI